MNKGLLKIRELGRQDFVDTWSSMMNIVLSKGKEDSDEVWFLEHQPVFTLGISDSNNNFLKNTDIPVMRTDRGGKVTYHGPGQLVIYFILNLRRLGWGPKKMIFELEELIVELLDTYGINSERGEIPGVFVEEKKIASIGIKIKRGFTYHGMSLNIDMDLEPFSSINPCGVSSMKVTQLKEYTDIGLHQVTKDLKSLVKLKFENQFE